LLADELDALGHIGAEECFEYFVQGTSEQIYFDLPYELTDRQDILLKEIVQSSGEQPGLDHEKEAIYQRVYSGVALEGVPAVVEGW
jgi:hypothetical protein